MNSDPSTDGLTRNVKALSAVSFAQDAGSEILYPLLPRFLTGALGAPVVALGLAEGLADVVAAGMKLAAGRLTQGRKRRWIALGYSIAAVGKLIVGLAFVWPVVIVGRAIDRVGKGIRGVPRDALIADDTPEGARGRAFGFHRSADTAGAVIGPLLGLALLHLVGGRLRWAILAAVIPAAISAGLVALVHERPAQPPEPPAAGASAPARRSLPTGIWRVLGPLAVFGLVNSTDILLLEHAGDVGMSSTRVVLAYTAYNVVYAVLGYPIGKLSDRVPHRYPFALGLLAFAAAYIGMGRAGTATAVWLLLPLYGLFPACTDGVSRAWISDLAPTASRTWALGVHGAVTGLGGLAAGLWTGLLWGRRGSLPLTVSGVVAAGVAIWLLAARTAWMDARCTPQEAA